MDNQKPNKKQPNTLPLAKLPIVTLTEKDMSSVNGGRIGLPGGDQSDFVTEKDMSPVSGSGQIKAIQR